MTNDFKCLKYQNVFTQTNATLACALEIVENIINT